MKNLTKKQEAALFGPEDHEAPIVKGKHTPGPWKVGQYAVNDYQATICDGENCRVAVCEMWKGELLEESHANALLIAAAPGLLKSLKYLIKSAEETTKDLIGFEGAGRLDYSIDCARAAIASAEGGTP